MSLWQQRLGDFGFWWLFLKSRECLSEGRVNLCANFRWQGIQQTAYTALSAAELILSSKCRYPSQWRRRRSHMLPPSVFGLKIFFPPPQLLLGVIAAWRYGSEIMFPLFWAPQALLDCRLCWTVSGVLNLTGVLSQSGLSTAEQPVAFLLLL